MFDTVLVANRGEIAVRVIRTLRALGVRSVAVFSDADADARHVREADTAVRIGPAPAAESYLSVERLLEAAARTGAQAVHPGYGFLAENASFARACAEAGLVFIGPPADAIALMGDKIRAKETVKAAGVPVVPGSSGSGLTDAQLAEAAREIGMPVLLKPSAGGGGKGMRLVRDASALGEEIAAARREARASFGDDTLLVERWVDRPRHIEIQVLADGHGNVVHLGERECSLQRRHQKIIEEAPSVLLDAGTRAAMGEAAVQAARSCGYEGAGTVEFIVPGSDPSSYYFMEMNTRLQVEHPVTELITGLDLVEWQLRVAAGERLPYGQEAITLTGHAVEARICAEDPARGFLPSGGTVLALHEPQGDGVRTDSGLSEGTEVGSLYDPMLSKVIAYGPDRATALRKLRAALAETVTLGVQTNAGFLRRLLAHPAVVAGDLDTGLVEREAEELLAGSGDVPEEVYDAAAAVRLSSLAPAEGGWTDPFSVPSGWRLGGEPAPVVFHLRAPGLEPVAHRPRGTSTVTPGRVSVTLDGVRHTFHRAGDWLGREGDAWHVRDHDPVAASLTGAAHAGVDSLTAPMPGTVTVVKVAVGDAVAAGQSLLVVEAMKMEHVISAPHAGTVSELDVTPGTTVAMDQVLAVITPYEETTPSEETT
ncbi:MULTISPECIES: acetyl/propionyl/methylcrotonyl-CoA carboxylase subunit alpha [unclassified Streptomyces]|uniref:acetyl-CoA carboxylase biotin carboxylase subunit n=1 Tax=unclassified Streptomyces TaxID=2593676 RepID=UPI001164A4FD|nr:MULTISPECIES: acetyl/propionyl/methylcrotonyl-CoA carboxylase subunit alpha [unclassified Streptomyces]NMI58504.1 acetyl/propionyl/methylcrotonyl-CoA carboxylase subunit alpha [Streptomyces sp. RLA2-12]QDN57838.1 acetyl/propionyl/methylcrotonyl-CoA carboxylase subunit alpha [Streptomyces sp. S1D4-20]QDN67935.1 acetyl/propionyl/methylcrotonyl-CoA carboxylase subunit alpha [Streptomyces sp. S1D4-14]QDO50349.1 acetyl/propionyl/methylcrotonyl-CoA carboxylase subunit alpha [Streptomyces sp. RLB3-